MNRSWPLVPLGEVIRHRKRFVRISDFETYKRCRVQLHAQGIVLRDVVSGAEIKTKDQQICRAGEFLVAEIDAKVGGFGVVPDELDGSIVSSHYFLFEIDEQKLEPRFLDYFVRTPFFRDQVAARGSTNYAAIRPHHVLQYQVPLPLVSEQRRIVARIEELAAKINEARILREQAVIQAQSLFFSCCERLLREAETKFPCRPLVELVEQERGISYGIVQTGLHFEGGISTVRAGDLHWFDCKTLDIKKVEPEIERTYQRTRLQGGELLLRIRGGVGELAVCPKELIGGNVSREIAVVPLTEDVNSRYAMFMLAAPTNQDRMSGHVKGTSYVGINLRDVRTLNLPVPPLSEQRRLVVELDALQAQVDALKKLQAETAAEIDALLPSILDKAFKGEL